MFSPLGTPALITAFQTVISTPNKGQASIISSSSFKHFTSLFPFMFTCMAVRHTLVWRTVYFPHSTETCRNSVLFIGGAMPQSTPLQHPNPLQATQPLPSYLLAQVQSFKLESILLWGRGFQLGAILLIPPTPGHFTVPGDFRVGIHGRQSCSVGAVWVCAQELWWAVSSPSCTCSSHDPPCTGPARGMRPSSSPCIGIRWNQK